MMYELKVTARFKKDYKRMKKQGRNMKLLGDIIDTLLSGESLDEKYRDHQLSGNYAGFRECHIQPDWLLIYMVDESQVILTVSRTGSHSDLLNL